MQQINVSDDVSVKRKVIQLIKYMAVLFVSIMLINFILRFTFSFVLGIELKHDYDHIYQTGIKVKETLFSDFPSTVAMYDADILEFTFKDFSHTYHRTWDMNGKTFERGIYYYKIRTTDNMFRIKWCSDVSNKIFIQQILLYANGHMVKKIYDEKDNLYAPNKFLLE